jgi:Cysteine protease
MTRCVAQIVVAIFVIGLSAAGISAEKAKPIGTSQFDSVGSAAESLGIGQGYVKSLAETKEKLSEGDFEKFSEQFGILPNGQITFQISPGKYFVLIAPADIARQPQKSAVEGAPRREKSPKKGAGEGDALLPAMVDHRAQQSPIKNQGQRGTCVAHAACADLEAILIRAGAGQPDLSENLAYLWFMKEEGSTPCNDPGLATFRAAGYLNTHLVCDETHWKYLGTDPADLAAAGECSKINDRPMAVIGKTGHGVDTYILLPQGTETDSNGSTDIKDIKTLETFLAAGRDIVFGTNVAWRSEDAAAIIDVRLGPAGQPLAPRGGHAMVIVGYDRSTENKPFFWVKNSWGEDYGHAGYLKISYDYLKTYAKYGYVTTKLKTGAVAD